MPATRAAPRPSRAIVLAAGLGQRMRPITDTLPKPLVTVGGKTMLDHALDRLAEAGIEEAVVNVHHLAPQVERHVVERARPRIIISDERALLLETGGGVKKALPLLGAGPFIAMNSDSLWIETGQPALAALIDAWDPRRMDMLLLLARRAASFGYDGPGDFTMDARGALARRSGEIAPFIFAGVSIMTGALFADTPDGPFSLNLLFDRAIARGRLFGCALAGTWLHVGTPDAIAPANALIAAGR
ncbi:MAG: mannose-1-phosphate guanylyltransferase [Rhizobiales bacterium 65-9]|nr:nucleotidyltransferase family protein [Hyphomicrobiales bacterium]OJY35060.1 MAG: mannose-1-phosphate guanylyltransferase [Rhizobiales bacterium 65-9]